MPTPPLSIALTGDVMPARLIDQLRPAHVPDPSSAAHIASFVRSTPSLAHYAARTPWGNTLPLFHASSLNVINLETAVTTHPTPWPNKAFNYRMHPANIDFLTAARVHYASLANNHSLDFCEAGLVETVSTLEKEGVKFAGAGRDRAEALRPAKLFLRTNPIASDADGNEDPNKEGTEGCEVHIYSAADHPASWSSIPGFHFVNYTSSTRDRLRSLLSSHSTPPPALKIFSIHWGPNYAWRPSEQIISLAHFLIDECGVDIVHGHSSHHVQGVEVYAGKLIIYGCGDFVDDYAVNGEFRNDISAVWRVLLEQAEKGKGVKIKALEIYPTACRRFVTDFLEEGERDCEWVRGKSEALSGEFGTEVLEGKGEGGRAVLVVNV